MKRRVYIETSVISYLTARPSSDSIKSACQQIDGVPRMNVTPAWHDPVVAEIHAIRERLAEQYHNDLLAYSTAAVARCRALGLNMVTDPHPAVQIEQSGFSIRRQT